MQANPAYLPIENVRIFVATATNIHLSELVKTHW